MIGCFLKTNRDLIMLLMLSKENLFVDKENLNIIASIKQRITAKRYCFPLPGCTAGHLLVEEVVGFLKV